MHTADLLGVLIIEFDDNLVGKAADSGKDTYTRGRYDLTILGDVSGFDYRYIDLSEETITEFLSQHR